MIRANASGSIACTGPPPATPALATTMSMPPRRSAVSPAARSRASRSTTSAPRNIVSPPSSAARCSSSSGSRPTSDSRAPLARSWLAVSAPIPRAAPVISTVLPDRSHAIGATPSSRTRFAYGNREAVAHSSRVVLHELLHRVHRLVDGGLGHIGQLDLLLAARGRRHSDDDAGADEQGDQGDRDRPRRA